jgi:hypothetical protein
MLADAARRGAAGARRQPGRAARLKWVQGDAMELPFADASFDAATMGYGLRNVADIPKALRVGAQPNSARARRQPAGVCASPRSSSAARVACH